MKTEIYIAEPAGSTLYSTGELDQVDTLSIAVECNEVIDNRPCLLSSMYVSMNCANVIDHHYLLQSGAST